MLIRPICVHFVFFTRHFKMLINSNRRLWYAVCWQCQMDAYSRMPWSAPVAGAPSMPYPAMPYPQPGAVEMPVPAGYPTHSAFGQPVAASTVRARLLECTITFCVYFVPCVVCQSQTKDFAHICCMFSVRAYG